MVATEHFVGRSVLRKEDAKLLTGQANFIDNQTMAGMVWMALVRPPHVHATIDSIDTSAAASMPGVLGVFTAADLADAFPAGLPMVWPITEDIKIPTHWPLTKDKIRFSGDAVAVVVAETREQAEDAAEVTSVSATDLPAVLDLEDAAKDEVVLHADLGTNAVVHWSHGGGGDQSVFDTAPVIVQERYTQPRLIPNAIEPRGCLAYGIPAAGEYTLVSATQIPHIARVGLSIATGIPQSKLRIIAPDVGGGFGSKLNVYAEEALALALARTLGRPVKWIETRQENYVATIHGRGVLHDCTLAGTDDGQDPGHEVRRAGGHGRVLPAADAGYPRARRLGVHGPIRPQGLLVRVHGRHDERHADRRLPRSRATRGDVRDRTARRRVRTAHRHGSCRGAAQELPAAFRGGGHVDHGPQHRFRQLCADVRSRARACRVRTAPQGTAGPTRRERPEAARHRPLQLHRDVRPRAVGDPGGAALRGGRLGRGRDRMPSRWQDRRAHRNIAARPRS